MGCDGLDGAAVEGGDDMTKNEKLRRRIAKLEAELAEARQRLDHLAKG